MHDTEYTCEIGAALPEVGSFLIEEIQNCKTDDNNYIRQVLAIFMGQRLQRNQSIDQECFRHSGFRGLPKRGRKRGRVRWKTAVLPNKCSHFD